MKVTINISSRDAEEILFALAMRSKQRSLGWEQEQHTTGLGTALNATFEEHFGWDKYDRLKHMRKPIKSVSIKCYDVAPNE